MADYKGLNIRFRGNTTDASKALHLLSSEAKSAQRELTGMQNALKNSETNGKNLNNALKQLQIEQVGKKAEAARGKLDAYSQSIDGLSKNVEKAQEKLNKNKDALAALPEKYGELGRVAKESFAQVSEAIENLDSAKSTMSSLSEGTDEYIAAQSKVAQAQEALNTAIESGDEEFRKVSATYGTLEGAINSAEESIRKNGDAIESTKVKMLEQQSAAQALERQHQTLSASFEASSTKLYQMGDGMSTFGSNIQSLGDSISSIGDKMTVVSAVAAVTFGRNVISQTEEYGNAIAQLGGYLDIQGSQLEDMSNQALKWGKDTQFSATEAAQAMNELAKGGMTQAQISGGAMEATMSLAAAGELNMADAAEVAVQAIKTFGLTAEDARAIADALAGAANTSTAEVSDLASGFKYAGGQAALAGWDINEVSGALALMSDHGLKGEMAGTALANVMKRLATPTDTAAEVMNQYGITVRNADGSMKGAVEVVQELQDKLGGLNDEAKSNALNDIFQTRGLVGAVALLEEGADSFQKYIDATTEAGYANEMAQTRMGELGWALEYLRGEAETAAVNFGQALAPTIKDVAKTIEDALEWFNNLSKSQQESIANTALMVTAAGPLISVIGHVSSGIGGLISTLGEGAKNISTFAKTLKTTGDIAGSLNSVSAGLAGTLSTGLVGVGIAAALVAVGALVNAYMQWEEHNNLVRSATEGLSDATQAAADAYNSYTQNVENSSRVSETIREDSEEILRSIADFADKIRSTMDDVGTNAAMADTYAESIKELSSNIQEFGSKGVDTSDELAKLQNAIKEYNKLTGAAIEVTDEQTGALNLLPSQIDEVTSAYKRQAEQKAYADLYSDAIKEQAKNTRELDRVNKELAKNEAIVNDETKRLTKEGQEAANNIEALWQSQSDLSKSSQALADNVAYYGDKIGSVSNKFSSVQTAMVAAGIAGEEYNNLTKQQLDELEAAFDGTIESISGILSKFGVAVGEVGSDVANGLENAVPDTSAYESATNDALEKMKKDMQRHNDDVYKAQQRAYDDEYKAAQRAYQDEYNLREKEIDRNYKEVEKGLKAEYDLRKKELDNEYKQYQDHFKAIEDAQKKSNDQKLKELKSSNDQQESALKKSLDAQYDIYKKSLDKEIDARKKANDEQLEALKKQQDSETSEYKKATDARLKEMEREYNAKLKLLEDNDETKQIDSRIKQLEKDTETEKRALKEKERNEKESELRKAVEQAKTRRKRAEAEKELNDYLEQIRVERNEEERKDEIELLKERKDNIKDEIETKKEALKDQYDAEKEAYKEFRDNRLEQIKDADSAEYDKLKERLDNELQAKKDANSTELEQIKESNQSKIEQMNDLHTQQEESYQEHLEKELEATKENNERQLEIMDEQHEAELEVMSENHDAILEALKEEGKDELSVMKDSQDRALELLKQSQSDQLEELKRGLDDQLSALSDTKNSAKDTGAQIAKDAKKNAKNATKNVRDELKPLPKNTENTMKSTKDKFYKKMNEISAISKTKGNEAGARLVDRLTYHIIPTEKAAQRLKNAAANKVSELPSKMSTIASNAGGNLATALANKGQLVSSASGRVANSASSGLNGLPQAFRTKGESAVNSFNSGVSSKDTYGPANSKSWDAVRGFDSHNQSAYNAGYNFTRGFGSGVEGPDIYWVAYDVGRNALDAIKHALGIRSPSKEGIFVGEMMIEGIIKGLDSKETKLARESRKMAEVITDELNTGVNASYSIGYDIKPEINTLANSVTEALRSGIPQSNGVTVVVKEMSVRNDTDIKRVSEGLYALANQKARRGW